MCALRRPHKPRAPRFPSGQDDVNNNPVIVYSFLSVNMIAFLCECIVVLRTMELCIRGPGLGLRGPEGSMTRAVFIMRQASQKGFPGSSHTPGVGIQNSE
jgi:hypothetical protein